MSKILVYDVDSEFRETMKTELTALGYETVLATDGYSVLPLAAEHRPRLIILDYKLPEAAGFEILQRLRKVPACASTPVIFASVTPKFEIEMTVMDDAAVGYVDKPLDVEQLKKTLEAMIGAAKPAADPAPAAAPPPRMVIPPPGAPLPPPVFNGEPDLDGSRDDVIDLD